MPAVTMNVMVAAMDRSENLPMPQTPWPLVQPEPILERPRTIVLGYIRVSGPSSTCESRYVDRGSSMETPSSIQLSLMRCRIACST